ncbi:MAG: circadian clock protein LdpA [Prochloraceae cyanobacterium]
MTKLHDSIDSLEKGNWFKLICGASFQHLPAVRSLVLAYTLAGADCIDVAADRAVIKAAKEAIERANQLQLLKRKPLLMVSLNDGEDPHFRKAQFNWQECLAGCSRPCQTICPAAAIDFKEIAARDTAIIADRCYGCGRCLPVCPVEIITTRSIEVKKEAIAAEIGAMDVDAIEIHTAVGNEIAFKQLWQAISPQIEKLKLISISCGDRPGLIDYLKYLYETITPLPIPLVWQTDGRPMSGDIGAGTTRATVKLAQKVIEANLPGYVQLAGGTNHVTVSKIQALGLLKNNYQKSPYIAGVAYGSYARSLLSPILEKLEKLDALAKSNKGSDLPRATPKHSLGLEEYSDLLSEATELAYSLVSQLKQEEKICFFSKKLCTTQPSDKINV